MECAVFWVVAGGCQPQTEVGFSNTVDVYDTKVGRWSEGPAMRSRRFRPGVSTIDGAIYVFGGEDVDR